MVVYVEAVQHIFLKADIKNNFLADLLIAKSISRDKFVNPIDYNKMSVVGFISYFFVEIPNIFALIIGITKTFILQNNLENLYKNSFIILSLSYMIFLIILQINTSKCKNR